MGLVRIHTPLAHQICEMIDINSVGPRFLTEPYLFCLGGILSCEFRKYVDRQKPSV